jgi:hypothetical protein
MDELTVKQGKSALSERSIQRFMLRKLEALETIFRLLGMNQRKVGEEERLRRWDAYGRFVPALLERLVSPDTPDFSRVAVGSLLDYFIPGWRAHVSKDVLGYTLRRASPEVRAWRDKVLERDDFICTECGATKDLHAHHIMRWADYPALRISADNGITLCERCHLKAHGGAWSLVPLNSWAPI